MARGNSRGEAFWKEAFRRFERSGMTVAEFCELEECSVGTFYAWRRRLRESSQPAFTELVVDSESAEASTEATGAIEIELPGDVRLRLHGDVDAARLTTVLECLRHG